MLVRWAAVGDTSTADIWLVSFWQHFNVYNVNSIVGGFIGPECQSGGLLADTADVWNRPVAAVEDRVAAAVPIVHGILNPPQ